ncbi:MAG: hypothetical protein ACKOD9_18335, partial [Rubrivivax sp.]
MPSSSNPRTQHRLARPSRRQALDRLLAAAAAVAAPGLALTAALPAQAQTGGAWPNKPIRLI